MRKSLPRAGNSDASLVLRSAKGPDMCFAAASILPGDTPLIIPLTIGTIRVITERKIVISKIMVSAARIQSGALCPLILSLRNPVIIGCPISDTTTASNI